METLIESGQSREHGCLAPMQGRSFIGYEGIFSIIKMPILILHVLNRPFSHLYSGGEAVVMQLTEIHERLNRLRSALDVYGESLIVIVSRCAVRKKKSADEVVVSFPQGSVIFQSARAANENG